MDTANTNRSEAELKVLGIIRGATGRQDVDRSIMTKEVRAQYPIEVDGLLTAGLATIRNFPMGVGRGVKLQVAGLFVTPAGRKALKAAFIAANADRPELLRTIGLVP